MIVVVRTIEKMKKEDGANVFSKKGKPEPNLAEKYRSANESS